MRVEVRPSDVTRSARKTFPASRALAANGKAGTYACDAFALRGSAEGGTRGGAPGSAEGGTRGGARLVRAPPLPHLRSSVPTQGEDERKRGCVVARVVTRAQRER